MPKSVGIFIGYLRAIIDESRPRRTPIVCVHQLLGRVGVVTRKDYDEASRRYWRTHGNGEQLNERGPADLGWVIPVLPIFVFTRDSEELRKLLNSCHVEYASFWIPDERIWQVPRNDIGAAWAHIHGRPMPEDAGT